MTDVLEIVPTWPDSHHPAHGVHQVADQQTLAVSPLARVVGVGPVGVVAGERLNIGRVITEGAHLVIVQLSTAQHTSYATS